MKQKSILLFAAFICAGVLSQSVGALALSPCQQTFKAHQKKLVGKKNPHYAVATTGGRSLTAPFTYCAVASGQSTKALSVKIALRSCNAGRVRFNSKGACKVIAAK